MSNGAFFLQYDPRRQQHFRIIVSTLSVSRMISETAWKQSESISCNNVMKCNDPCLRSTSVPVDTDSDGEEGGQDEDGNNRECWQIKFELGKIGLFG